MVNNSDVTRPNNLDEIYDKDLDKFKEDMKDLRKQLDIIHNRNTVLWKYLILKWAGLLPHIYPELYEDENISKIFSIKLGEQIRGKKTILAPVFMQNILGVEERQARVYLKTIELDHELNVSHERIMTLSRLINRGDK